MECPYIDKRIPNPGFNKRLNYAEWGGEDYVFYDHDDGFGNITRVQFCQLIGRKADIFQCLNESEWHVCPHFRFAEQWPLGKAARNPINESLRKDSATEGIT